MHAATGLFLFFTRLAQKSLLMPVCLLIPLLAAAQHNAENAPGKITGRVVDSLSGAPVEYASISLQVQGDTKVVNGATTDDKGQFELNNIAEGTYKVLVYFIGYKTGAINKVVIGKSAPVVALGNVRVVNQQTTLKEVTVTTERSLIENKIDKMVYNAEKDLTSQGGVATDILKKVPQVSVDVDGNVELQGNANIRFLINGKPSSVFGNNLADVLQSIPASQIQSIEVITSPGARYDAEGTGGIINIILKKSTAQGINGNMSLSAGTRLENGSFNLNGRKGHFGANAFLSGNAQLLSTTINTLDRESVNPSAMQRTSLLQGGKSDFSRNGGQGGVGFDWDITPKNSLTGSFTYNYFDNSTVGYTNRQTLFKDIYGSTLFSTNNVIDATSKGHSQIYDWNLNYKHNFDKEDQVLEVLYSASDGNNYSYYSQVQRFVSPDSVFSGSYGRNPGSDKQTNISVNYTQPVNEKVLFETGAKTVLYQVNSLSDVFLFNSLSDNYSLNNTQSNSIRYDRDVYAAYLSGTFKLKFFDIKAGCRYEHTDTRANFSNVGNVSIKPYNTVVPSFVISKSLAKNQTIKLSYTYRIQRPDYRDLNPFINASDPKNVSTGNPNLRPETAHNIEIGYSRVLEKGANINVALFYRGNRDDIQSYTSYYPTYKIGDSTYTNVAVSTRENIGSENNFGANLFASVPVTSKINVRTNIAAFQRYIINNIVPGSNVHGFNYRINVNASYQVTGTMSVELFGNFNSPRVNVQGTMPAFTTYNFALRKQFFHKQMSLAFTTTNPFNKYVNQRTRLTGENFTLYSLRELPYRSFGLNFTYKFGKLEFKKDKLPDDANLTNPSGS